MDDSNVNINHISKQRKKKNLPNTMVYGSLDKVVELHELGDYEVEKKQLKTHIKELIKENENLNTRLDNTKSALNTTLDRIEKIEGKMKIYGLK